MNTDNIKIGEKLQIHCYKHDGSLHRKWDEAIVLDILDDYIVFGNNRCTVIDSDGKIWKTREPAVMFFYKNRWFNIIGQLKDYGIYFYCIAAFGFCFLLRYRNCLHLFEQNEDQEGERKSFFSHMEIDFLYLQPLR